MDSNLNELKKKIFYDMLNLAGRVFILVRHSENVIIGSRGFLPAEKDKGIVLVFNQQMSFLWDDFGISATLVFGSKSEKCFIPAAEILSVFSPELSAQFSISQKPKKAGPKEETGVQKVEKPARDKKVVKVDFKKKR